MSGETDLPRPRTRIWSRLSGRAVVIALGAVLLLLVIFGRAIARFYVSALWHDALGRTDVFWGQIWRRPRCS